MTTQYTLIKQLHDLIPQLNEKYGVCINIQNEYYIDINNQYYHNYQMPFDSGAKPAIEYQAAIQAPQIRQILVELKEVLGDSTIVKEKAQELGLADYEIGLQSTLNDVYHLGWLDSLPHSQAEALCQKWLDGLEPLIDREPETVLTELLEILKKLV